jgi:hypothetical protein
MEINQIFVLLLEQNMREKKLFQTSHTGGLVYISDKSGLCPKVRRFAGESVLNMYGLPAENERVPNVVLYMTPSAFFTLGPRRFFQFKKDWPGVSEVQVGDGVVPVVTYTTE